MNFKDALDLPPLRGSCVRCHGWGYTEHESPLFRDGKTLKLGSGCERCLGDGIDPEWRETLKLESQNGGRARAPEEHRDGGRGDVQDMGVPAG